jgi:hypothetical protein
VIEETGKDDASGVIYPATIKSWVEAEALKDFGLDLCCLSFLAVKGIVLSNPSTALKRHL